jgi:HK97 family phage prohead protease
MTSMQVEVRFADPGYQSDGKARHPLDTADQIRAAWSHISKTENQKPYTEAQVGRIKARITSAWKAKIDAAGPPAADDKVMMEALHNEVLSTAKDYAPDPEEGESHEDFLERCVDEMTGDGTMDEDDATEACQLAWDESNGDDDGKEFSAGTVLHKTHSTEASGMDFVLSDATPDRMGDIIEPAGWTVENFQRNPIALFGHDSKFAIGKWSNIRVGDDALRAELVLAPKGTSPRIDEIRALVDADILRAVSVGFRSLDDEPINPKDPWGGTRFKKSELMECSLVTVPANPNALAVAKSLNISPSTVRMVFGEHASDRIVRREVPQGEHANNKRGRAKESTGEHAETHRDRDKGKPMLLSKRIQDAEAGLLALQDNLDKHLETIDDANPTGDQMVVTEDLTAKIENATRHLNSLKAIEARNGATATDATEVARNGGGANGGKPPVGLPAIIMRPKKVEPLDYLWRAAVVRCKSKADGADIDVTRRKIYGEDEVTRVMCDMMLKAASAPAETTVTGWAAELVRTIWADWMAVLLPMSVFPRLAAKGLGLTFGANGRIVIPTRSLVPSVSGSFVAEGAPIPVRQTAFASQTLTPKKLAVITTWTREMQDYSIPAIEGLLRQAVLEDTAISLDTVLLDSNAATTVRPAGLQSYQTPLTPAATAGQFFANFEADYKALYGALLTLTKGNVRTPVLIINPTQGLYISLLQPPAAAAPLFPFMAQVDNGRVLKSDTIESATVPAGTAIMVDAADFTTAGVEGPRMEISDQATLHMEDTTPADIVGGASPGTPAYPVKSMYQTDSLALRMIMMMNWVMRRPVVASMSGVQWG